MARSGSFAWRLLLAAAFALVAVMGTTPVFAWADEPSQAQVVQFMKDHPWQPRSAVKYSVEPQSDGATPGVVAQETQQEALNCVNTVRYAAGLSLLTLDEGKISSAQAAAYVNGLNDTLSHYPTKPSNCNDSIYALGEKGARQSNIACGAASYYNHIDLVKSLVGDSGGEDNLTSVGHRRWILCPTLKTTGFGFATLDSSKYLWAAMRTFNDDDVFYPTDKVIKWPTKNTPLDLFEADSPWLIEVGTGYKPIDKTRVSVVLEDLTHRKTWTISSQTSGTPASGESYISVQSSLDNCIGGLHNSLIFRPKLNSAIYKDGSKYRVTIKGLQNADGSNATDLVYDVNFFQVNLIKLAIPEGKTFVYDGSFHSIHPGDKSYRLISSRDTVKAREPGTYTAIFEPAPGYCWSDGSISQKAITWSIVNSPNTSADDSTNSSWEDDDNYGDSDTWTASSLASAAVAVKDKAYTGKTLKPSSVVVKVGGKTLIKDRDFTVSCKGGKKIGAYTVTIKGKGSYTGTATAKFRIVPKGVAAKKPSAAKRGFTAKWKRPASKYLKQTTGYQIQWSTDKKFKKAVKSKLVKGAKKTSLKVTKLKPKKTYYVKVRAYKQVGKTKYYSSWSKVQKVKTKK